MRWALEVAEVHRKPELTGVSFGAPLGGVTVVLGGVRGARKLLFRMALGLEYPERGAIIVNGRDASRTPRRKARPIAAVFSGEDFALFDTMTAYENVAGAVRTAGRAGRRGADEAAMEALERVGLLDAVHDRPSELTLDARRRLAYARALALRAPLLMVDNADGADAPYQELVGLMQLLHEDRDTRGASAVLMAIEPGVLTDLADHVVDLDAATGAGLV